MRTNWPRRHGCGSRGFLCDGVVGLRPAPQRTGSSTQTSRPQSSWPRNQGQTGAQTQGRPRANVPHGVAPGYPAPRSGYPGPPYIGPSYARPVYPGFAPPVQGPPGHLGDWLNQHRNLPAQEQERMLRGDPNFRRLPPAEQQRVVRQLHQVNQLSEEQRQRRLARSEMIEHLPPQNRCGSTSPRAVGPPARRPPGDDEARLPGSARGSPGEASDGTQLCTLPGRLYPRGTRHPL